MNGKKVKNSFSFNPIASTLLFRHSSPFLFTTVTPSGALQFSHYWCCCRFLFVFLLKSIFIENEQKPEKLVRVTFDLCVQFTIRMLQIKCSFECKSVQLILVGWLVGWLLKFSLHLFCFISL